MTHQARIMTSGGVARRLGISYSSLYKLDAILCPERSSSGGRLYDSEVVERIALEREERAAAKTARRAAALATDVQAATAP